MAGADPILSDEEVAALWAEHDRLSAQRTADGARMVEITRRIIDSGEAKVRAARTPVDEGRR